MDVADLIDGGEEGEERDARAGDGGDGKIDFKKLLSAPIRPNSRSSHGVTSAYVFLASHNVFPYISQ